MRRRARVDANQAEIVAVLRRAGASVLMLHTVGQGCPDILVGKDGKNWLFEIKDPMKPPSQKALSEDEREFHAAWRGQVTVIETAEHALEKIG